MFNIASSEEANVLKVMFGEAVLAAHNVIGNCIISKQSKVNYCFQLSANIGITYEQKS